MHGAQPWDMSSFAALRTAKSTRLRSLFRQCWEDWLMNHGSWSCAPHSVPRGKAKRNGGKQFLTRVLGCKVQGCKNREHEKQTPEKKAKLKTAEKARPRDLLKTNAQVQKRNNTNLRE